ncbi:hypothetical protein JOM56_014866 [Amanita muscaria]
MYPGCYSSLAEAFQDFHDDDSASDAEADYYMDNPPVISTPSPNPTSPSLIPGETPLAFSTRLLEYTLNNQASDEQRAKAFIQLWEDCADTLLKHVDRKIFNRMIAHFAKLTCFRSHAVPCASEIRPYDTDGYFFSDVEDSVKVLYPTVPSSPASIQMDIDTKDELIIPPSLHATPPSPEVSLPKRDFFKRDDNKSFQIRNNRAMSAPVNHMQQMESAPPRAQTAPPSLSRNTVTARRCMSKGPSPVSYVKFLDVPYTSQDRYMEMLKENTKWSTAKVSRIETFGMKTAQGNWNIKICFKDDAQSTLVKKLLTTSVSFDTVIRRCRPWYLQTRPSTHHA